MNPPVSTHAIAMAVLAMFIAWRVYVRVRRLIGRQPVHRRRLYATAIVFPLLLVLVGLPSMRDARLVEAWVGGAVLGVIVGLAGLRLTKFEATAEGHFYRPNTILGVAISLLFIGRLIYRIGAIYMVAGTFDPQTMQSFGRSALTLLLFGVVALYYTTFSIGVLAWDRRTRLGSADAPPAGTSAV